MKLFRTIVAYFLALFIVLDYYSVYWMTLHDIYGDRLLFLFKSVILLFVCIIGRDRYCNGGKINNICKAIIASFVLLLGIPDWTIWFYLFVVILPLFSFYFASDNSKDGLNFSFFNIYSNVVITISLISLFFWFVGPISGYMSPNCVLPNSWGARPFIEGYYNIFYETQNITVGNTTLCRNTGFMCEAPVFNLNLCVALAFELFVCKRVKRIKIAILIIAILSTLSTTGQLFIMLAFLLKSYQSVNRKRSYKILFWFLLPILLYIMYFVSSIIMVDKMDTDSYESRSYVINKMIGVLENNPLLGAGINRFHLSSEYGVSNSLFHVMADGGLYLTFFFIYYIVVIPYRYMKKKGDMGWLFFNLSFLFVFTFTLDYNRLLDMAILGFSIANAKSYIETNRKSLLK